MESPATLHPIHTTGAKYANTFYTAGYQHYGVLVEEAYDCGVPGKKNEDKFNARVRRCVSGDVELSTLQPHEDSDTGMCLAQLERLTIQLQQVGC